MKNTNNRPATIQFNKNKRTPEQRDNLDSRKNEEFDIKGDKVTHTQKPQRNREQKKKN